MKRTIKFRGKYTETGEWRYGYYARLSNEFKEWHCIMTEKDASENYIKDCNGFHMQYTPVVPSTVGQFTGLCDKNGKEIYDGDIIYSEFPDGSKTNCLIGWNEENSCFGLMDEYNYRSKLEGYDFQRFDNAIFCNFLKHSKKFEVIGNIYDNPELLKGGEA